MALSKQTPGTFIISLDFELHWGVRDVKTVEQYRENLIGVRRAVPAMLAAFADYDVHATWAAVGFLFFRRRSELLQVMPKELPQYENPRLSPYLDIEKIGEDENEDPFHFGRSLLEQIRCAHGQEIGTQTFSHYYCLEPAQSTAAFRADLRAAKSAAADFGVAMNSIVFPRNQYDAAHLRVCAEVGLKAYRGNPQSWLYRPRSGAEQTRWVRAARLADSYCNLSSHYCYRLPENAEGVSATLPTTLPTNLLTNLPTNLPASRFLRPYSANTLFQRLQERRVRNDLTYAAQRGLAYHLWWHPHNFGKDVEKNIGMLRRLLDHFHRLREDYGMQSKNMAESTLSHPQFQNHGASETEENRFAGQGR